MKLQPLFNLFALLFVFILVQPSISYAQKEKTPDPRAAALGKLSREEKNTMSTCPLHGKHMGLSDNYRANASDSRQCDDYPFAYQLNYRRYCPVCTKVLEKEEKAFTKEERAGGGKATMERCAIHNEFMQTNKDFSSVNSIHDDKRDADILNAGQYLGRLHCKTCSKIYRIRYKDKDKDEK